MLQGSVGADGVGVLELSRPKKRNALGWSFFSTEFPAALQELLAQDVRCIVLVAAGASFCSGIDLSGESVAMGFGCRASTLGNACDSGADCRSTAHGRLRPVARHRSCSERVLHPPAGCLHAGRSQRPGAS